VSVNPEQLDDLDQLKRALVALRGMRARVDALEQARTEPIAIIGIGCRLPGDANTPARFWKLLCEGVDAIGEVPADRWDANAFYDPDPNVPGKMPSKYGGFIRDVDQFDPHFFGISPREAARMDPQQRIVLEVAWEALEDAGVVPAGLAGSKTGVFIGIGLNDYGRLQVPEQTQDPTLIDTYTISGNALCITANRLSYLLDLRGPSVAVDTACSSSLVAVHLACQSLRSGDSALALAGGVNLMLAAATPISLAKFLAPDGRCKAFDARADGYVRAEGAAVIVLKPLSRALADGDPVYAVIRGSAVNQDGFSSGLTVPNGVAQQAMLREALANAGKEPQQIDYVETHGTGTSLGDPIEANALGSVLGANRQPGEECLIGSVKTNIGHLEAAAGIAGLVKVALALKHGQIPPSLHFETPNPHIAFGNLGLRVAHTLTSWPRRDRPSLAGVSSFGFGGTNAHVILEAPPPAAELPPATVERPAHVLTLSAKTDAALRELAARYAAQLAGDPHAAVGDVAYSANTGRAQFPERLAVVAETTDQLRERLALAANGESGPGVQRGRVERQTHPRIAFLFTGQGAQHAAMAQQLYATQPTFRAALDQCDAVLRPHLPRPLLEVLYPRDPADAELIHRTGYTQPALFALEYALAELWRSWGVEPSAVLGHSVGEYAAACVAGVFSLEDGLRLIAARGRLMEALPPGGAMAAVRASPAEAEAAIAPYANDVSLAAVNGPQSVVLAGAEVALTAVLNRLAADGVKSQRLSVSHAFHSPLLEPILGALQEEAARVACAPPRLRLVANVTGQPWPAGEAPDAAYWRQQARRPVRFHAGLEALWEQGYRLFVEMGPRPTLVGLAQEALAEAGDGVWLPSLRPGRDDWAQMLDSLSALYVHGVPIDWAGFDCDYPRRRVALPTYPFQRQHYWFGHAEQQGARPQTAGRANRLHPLLGGRLRSRALSGVVFESCLGPDSPPYLTDHRVYGAAVLPATAYVEMALAAARAAGGGGDPQLGELVIQQALVLPEDADCNVQVELHRRDDETVGFATVSERPATSSGLDRALGDAEPAWQVHATGSLRISPPGPEGRPGGPPADANPGLLVAAQARCQEALSIPQFYEALGDRGLNYGPAFRTLEQLWRGEGEAIGRIRLPDELRPAAASYRLHPVLLDGCLQVAAALFPPRSAGEAVVYLPLSLGRVRLHDRLGPEVWSHFALQAGHGPDRPMLKGCLRLFDPSGRVVAEVDDIQLKRATPAALHLAVQPASVVPDDPYADWCYEIAWEQQPRAATPRSLPAGGAGRWLILADGTGVGAALARRLEAEGAGCTLVRLATDDEAPAADGHQLTPVDPGRVGCLLADALDDGRGAYRGIVHLWSLDLQAHAAAAPGPTDAQRLTCGSVLSLVQALSMAAREPSDAAGAPRLWLVTRGAQPVLEGAAPDPLQAPLWGLGRVIAREHPELSCVCIDLDPADEAGLAADLFDEVWLDDRETEVALRGGDRYVARLVRKPGLAAPAPPVPGADAQPWRLAIDEPGVLDNLTLRPATRQAPGPGEVEIRVHATGLNFRDVLSALGMYPGDAGPLGQEAAGRVVAVGADVDGLRVGDEVIAIAPGSFGSYVTVNAALAIRKPHGLSLAEAATIPIAFSTAYYALHHLAQLRAGERVLIHAAAGGVGLAAVALAQRVGAEVFGTAGSPEKREYLRSLGVQHVMDSRSLAFADEVMALTAGQGVDVVLNSLADEFIPRSLAVLKEGGRFLEIGKRGIWTADQVAQLGRHVAYHPIYLGEVCQRDPALIQAILRALVSELEAGTLRPLPYQTFPLEAVVDAFRQMAQARHIGKLVILHPAEHGASRTEALPATFRADGTYLITGGLGGLGLQVARRMVERGARHLVLLGRSAPSGKTAETLRALEGAGARVKVVQADVACADAVERTLADVAASMPPLRGVVHAAGVVDDGVLLQQDWTRFARVMAPKIDGSHHLDTLTRGLPLDFFVLFSAGAGLLGAPGQGNYAAANAFLDALAHRRRAEGRPALSVNWGPWSEAGMAAALDERDRRRLAEQGVGSIEPEQGLDVLERLLLDRAPQVAVLPLDWQRFALALPATVRPSLFVELTAERPAETARGREVERSPTVLQRLAAAPPSKRRSVLLAHVRDQLGRVLNLDAGHAVDPQQPLSELGLDSLMAVELRNSLSASLGQALPASLLFDYPSLSALTDYLATEVPPLAAIIGSAVSPPAATDQQRDEQARAIAALEQLSEDEAEAVLLAELALVTGSNHE